LEDLVGFSINKLVMSCGYKPNLHKDMINDKCKQILYEFINLDMFADYPNEIYTCKANDYLEVKLNYEWFDRPDNFAYIYYKDVDDIINFRDVLNLKKDSSNITSSKILLLLSYIRVKKLRRTELQTNTHPEEKPEYFYKHYKDIGVDLGMNEDVVSLGTEILNKLNIIVSKEIPHYQDDKGNWHTDVTLFVDKQDGWEQELIWAEEHIKITKKRKYSQGKE
jgi:hypothetical protein